MILMYLDYPHSQKTCPNSCVTVLLAKLLKFVASALMVLALTFIVNFVVYLLSYSEFFVFPQPRSNATTTVTFLTSSFSLWFSAILLKLKNSTKCVNSRISTYPFCVVLPPSRQLFQFPREVLSLPHHQQAQESWIQSSLSNFRLSFSPGTSQFAR